MPTEYDLENGISLPEKLLDKPVDGYHIILAPDNPNWIVLNDKEYKMFHWLQEGASIRFALENYYIEYCPNEDECLKIMKKLLEQIDDVDFRGNSVTNKEEAIENITKTVHIGTTNGCNMHCPHCYMAAGTQPLKTVDLQKTIQLISELHDFYGELEVVVSGGEPLTYTNIESLLKGIQENHVILFTNGSLISERNIDLICECCDEIQISFEAVSKEYYAPIRGEQNYENALHAIDLLKSRGKRIVLATTILPNTLIDIENNLISFIKHLEYDNLEVRLSDEIEMAGNALFMDMSGFDKKYSRELVIKLVKKLKNLGYLVQSSDIRNIRFTNCGIGSSVLINYDGRIYPCHKISSYYFEAGISANDIIREFNKINVETSNDKISKCRFCELRYICSGGCRIDNLNTTGSMIEPICDDIYKERQYRRLLNDYRMYRENR